MLVTENESVELKKDREERYAYCEGVAYVSGLLVPRLTVGIFGGYSGILGDKKGQFLPNI